MIYRKFENLNLSALGLGAMRLPVLNNSYREVDEAETAKMVSLALERGINYFDTAYGYHDGKSEVALGKALAQRPRESFYLADKFPGYDLSNMDKVDSIFEEQLRRCGRGLFRLLSFPQCLREKRGAVSGRIPRHLKYLLEQKANGRIRHLGFSCHGSLEVLQRFLDAYGQHMEFCQIQLNYLDWDFQDAKAKVALLNQRNLPIWVMEPLRGGKLAKLSGESEAKLKALRPDEGIPAWAFRFLQSVPGVTMVLSGMSSMEQLQDNLATFETDKPLTEAERGALLDVAHGMVRQGTLPCTACRYCTSHCPQQLDIPNLLALYNEHCFTGGGFIAPMAVDALPEDKRPSACIGCRSCEAVCPQQIKISEAMADFAARLK
jgi:predicted aldo/keto reductase-like oxidoreductase